MTTHPLLHSAVQSIPAPRSASVPLCPIPIALIRAYAHRPLLIGAYFAIARLVLLSGTAVPISVADLTAWVNGGTTRNMRIGRAIAQLTQDGWLIGTPYRSVKTAFMPTWGRRSTDPVRPWQPNQPQRGRPAYCRTVPIPVNVIDYYIGCLEPRPGRVPAFITRYYSRPLLDLDDLGIYVLMHVMENVAPTAALELVRLTVAAKTPTPTDLMQMLQQVVDGLVPGVELSRSGRQRSGMTPPSDTEQTVSGSMSGSGSGSMSGSDSGSGSGSMSGSCSLSNSTALECAEMEVHPTTLLALERSENLSKEERTILPSPNHDRSIGGGGLSSCDVFEAHDPDHPLACRRQRIAAAIGIQHYAGIADAPTELIEAWHTALQSPAMRRTMRNPAAVAYRQIQAGVYPVVPEATPLPTRPDSDAQILELNRRVRAIAPPGTSPHQLLAIRQALSQGVSDTDALQMAGGVQ